MMRTLQEKYIPIKSTCIETSRMKGSSIKTRNQPKDKLDANKMFVSTQEKQSGIVSKDLEAVSVIKFKNQSQIIPQQISKTLSVFADKQLTESKVWKRINTPIIAKNYSKSPTTKDQYISEKVKTEKIIGRYNNQIEQLPTSFGKLSLSNFQQKIKAINSKGASHSTVNTEAELINLKLEGTSSIITKGIPIKSLIIDKPVLSQKRSNVYITQDHNIPMNKNECKSNQTKNVEQFQQILSKIHIEEQNILKKTNKNIQKRKSSFQRYSNLRNKIQRPLSSIRDRERMKINVINFSENHFASNIKAKHYYQNIYFKFFKQHTNIEKISLQIQHKSMMLNMGQTQINQGLKTFQNEIMANSINQEKKIQEKSIKYIISQTQQKYNKRKSLLKDYTFKKNIYQKQEPIMFDDFHVDGWNNSQQFERKEVMIL